MMKYPLSLLFVAVMASPAAAFGWHHDCEWQAAQAEVRAARAHGRLGPCELDALAEQQRQMANQAILWQYQSGLVATPAARRSPRVGPFNPRVLYPIRPQE
jgi:hypothetical protein